MLFSCHISDLRDRNHTIIALCLLSGSISPEMIICIREVFLFIFECGVLSVKLSPEGLNLYFPQAQQAPVENKTGRLQCVVYDLC